MWVVRDGDDIYVRSVNGRGSSWFRGAQDRHEARIRAGGVEKDVEPDRDRRRATTLSMPPTEAKYGRRYPTIVPSIVAPEARAATLKLVPAQEEEHDEKRTLGNEPGGLGDRARLHGHEPELPADPRPERHDRADPRRRRARRHLLRHRAGLRAVRQRGARRRGARAGPRPGRDRDQVRLRALDRRSRRGPDSRPETIKTHRRGLAASGCAPTTSTCSTSTASTRTSRSRTSPAPSRS